MARKTWFSWSSGKDSAWALHRLRQDPTVEVKGLFTTVNRTADRVAMHGVRRRLLEMQADSVGLPLHIIEIPWPCSNEEYAATMSAFVDRAREDGVECFAFGDLFLEDIRRYREENLVETGITPLFPIWGLPTETLSREMVASGLKAVITCLDPRRFPDTLAGRVYDDEFLKALPQGADPCGEYGEFHSFAFDGPMFRYPVPVDVGETVRRDGFVFTDLLPRPERPG